jgi:hypothetical protein
VSELLVASIEVPSILPLAIGDVVGPPTTGTSLAVTDTAEFEFVANLGAAVVIF